MFRHILFVWMTFLLIGSILMPLQGVLANSNVTEKMINANKIVDQSLEKAKTGDLIDANLQYKKFKTVWRDIEDGIKSESAQAYKDIEANMGKVTYAFSRNKQEEVVQALIELTTANNKFINGDYQAGNKFEPQNISLSQFIVLLQNVKEEASSHKQNEAIKGIENVTDSWLSVEGVIVAQSTSVYNSTEKDMVTIQAMLISNPPDFKGAIAIINNMIDYLTPLAEKTSYTMWDAALIIIREGLEALLVITALLAFVSKSKNARGNKWIWSGAFSGIFVSIILAIIIKYLFTIGTFGNNNALISGWTGIIAAIMLLYVSYWLHSNTSIKKWQQFIHSKTKTALNTGKLVTLAFLSFLAVFREGTETVLFFIGMINQISIQNLILGLLIGIGLLLIITYLIIFIGVKLPIRPFFIVSSFIVFYLTIKFLGMGIHSLQLAGVIPTTSITVPSIELFAFYPSLQSLIPQLTLIIAAIIVVFLKRERKNEAL